VLFHGNIWFRGELANFQALPVGFDVATADQFEMVAVGANLPPDMAVIIDLPGGMKTVHFAL
jgi:hypothetical protein